MQILNNISSQIAWWQQVKLALNPVFDTVKIPSQGQTQAEIETKLDALHNAYSMAHRINMPMYIQVQLIATLCNLQTSYCAGFEKQHGVSTRYHKMAQAQWIMFQNLLRNEGIHCHILQ